ncbi:MAG: aminotransferase class I/II-fold pyridoxal phosphate-dependent enzyme [Mycobacteriaceae bacterium]|nr:aminotransferase class I/II-fold pyridoxal phosphate-dependent enzyme [Mycobacteriaceae bacterium]
MTAPPDVVQFDLSLSENPFPPLPSVQAAIADVMEQANRYPEFLPQRLPKLVADRVGVSPDQVVVGAGATGVAMQIVQSAAREGDGMVFGAPTFDGYPVLAEIAGVRPIPVPLDSQGCQDLPAMAAAADSRTALLVVCRPHNPTGTLNDAAELEDFLRRVPPEAVVILDEAYIEFVSEDDVIDPVRLVDLFPNVLVLRTFSKAFGLAGLRIGYAFGAADLAASVRRRQLPFGMSAVAVAAVAASYAAEHELCARVERITAEREAMRDLLVGRGAAVPHSHGNFLYIPGPGVADALHEAGIRVKAFPDGSARVAVGDADAGRAVRRALVGVTG